MGAKPASPDEGPTGQRRWPRRPVYFWGTVRALGCASERLLVLNLSKGGLMGQTRTAIPEGRFVEVALPGMAPAMARVIWNREGKVGAQFMRQMPI